LYGKTTLSLSLPALNCKPSGTDFVQLELLRMVIKLCSYLKDRHNPTSLKMRGYRMMRALQEIRDNRNLVNDINWDMTPEEAVTLYLEWGNNWSHGKHLVDPKRRFPLLCGQYMG
jgi:hypothetical protein